MKSFRDASGALISRFVGLAVLLCTAAPALADEAHEAAEGFSAASLVEPLGITTISLMVAAVALGWLRVGKARLRLRLHKICGIAALLCAAAHATIIMLLE